MIRTFKIESRLRLPLVVVGALAIVGCVGAFVVARMTALPDDAVFELHGDVVTTDELDDRLVVLKALYGVQRPAGDEEFNRAAAKSMAVSRILEEASAERDIVIADKVAQDTLDKLIDAQMTDGRAAFDDFLAASGISEVDVLDEIKRQLATSRLVEEVTAGVAESTAEEVRAAYDSHQDTMVTPERRRLRNIVVASKGDAVRVIRLARAGSPFPALAATWSRDGTSRDKGGSIGTVTEDMLEEEYAAAAFAAPLQGYFGPVKTRFGWNVGLVVSIVPAEPLTFDQVRSQIATELRNKARLQVWRDYLTDLLKDADVEYADDYRPDHPYSPPTELPE